MNTLPLPEVKEINQWEKNLFDAISNPATFERMWNNVPEHKPEIVAYEWPESEIA